MDQSDVHEHTTVTTLNEDEAREVLALNAKKLAILLYDSTFPDDVKEAIISLLAEMTLEQIDALLAILEAKYVDQQTAAIDEEFKIKIEGLVKDYEAKRAKSDEDTLKGLESVQFLVDSQLSQ